MQYTPKHRKLLVDKSSYVNISRFARKFLVLLVFYS
jgi:hypothetical protein